MDKKKIKYFFASLLIFIIVCKTYLTKDDFSTGKDLTAVDSVYLGLQTATSIGFGEIHPVSQRGRIVFSIYFAIILIFVYFV